jgi:quercetin dioxygenase-like cupin family protein
LLRIHIARLLLAFGVAASPIAIGCGSDAVSQGQESNRERRHSAVALAPAEGTELWFQPSSQESVGDGAVITLKIDRVTVPHARMMAAAQTLAAAGIPVHAHIFEDELIYVVRGEGVAIVGDAREEIALEPGSVVYIPPEEWHGVRNADPDNRMEILVVTTPSVAGGLADFFRQASVRPGHPPLDLSEEEFLALFHEYGMRVPNE